jgi:hypothetical protein
MAEALERIEIGFAGGQVVSTRLSPERLKELASALDGQDGWLELKTDDGDLALDLRQVVFVRKARSEHSIGFGD